ncbi:MAG: two-component system, OmpR family, sensor histidine kinase KdpD, partial [Candidatus Eremiobacteraeota bacterium]|nr:two-component system, OmpR family, sensor histidine kinase KdpD [Candidatus Eremiobacteraeota bacterium]
FLQRAASFADALDLALEASTLDALDAGDERRLAEATLRADGGRVPLPDGLARGDLRSVRASLVIVPYGPLADRILTRPVDRELLVADPARLPLPRSYDGARHPYATALGDRLRIGYGKLTIYLGAVAGSGKTYAMLDRAHQLVEDGVDVAAALVETHGRAETAAKLAGLEQVPRLANGELDVDALLLRRPKLALIDELAHTNAGAGARAKRYDDVIAVLRSGIDVLTTLNVQHLEGVADAVERLTGTRVRETLPDSVLEFADEVVFVDVTPDVLRQRLRQGKVYPPERVDAALGNFFRTANLAALRELAVREVLHARSERGRGRPFARIVLGVAPRARDAALIHRAGRLAKRLDVDLRVICVSRGDDPATRGEVDLLARATAAARGTFVAAVGADAAVRIVEMLTDGDVLAVESPRRKRPPFGRHSFAVRVLAAGARELLVLAPREGDAQPPP